MKKQLLRIANGLLAFFVVASSWPLGVANAEGVLIPQKNGTG
jgi:hypothetical protein